MPDDPAVDPKKKDDGVDIKTALDAIEQRVTAKLSEGLSSIDKRISAQTEPPEEDANPWETSEEDEPITKKDFSSIVDKVSEQVSKRTEATFELKGRKAMRDRQAMTDFPEMFEGSPTFNRRFFDEVSREMEQRVKNGRKGDDIDLVYDSGASVAARGVREGWYAPKARAIAGNQRRNVSDDSFDVNGRSAGSKEPSESQVKFAASMGLSKEKLSQHLKKIG